MSQQLINALTAVTGLWFPLCRVCEARSASVGTSPRALNQPCPAAEPFRKLQEVARRFQQSLFSLGEVVDWRAWCWELLSGHTLWWGCQWLQWVGAWDRPPARPVMQWPESTQQCQLPAAGPVLVQGSQETASPRSVNSLETTLACKSRLSCRLPGLVTPQTSVTSPDWSSAGSVHSFGRTPRALPAPKYPKAGGKTDADGAEPSQPARQGLVNCICPELTLGQKMLVLGTS